MSAEMPKMSEEFYAFVRDQLSEEPVGREWRFATEWLAWQEAARQAMERTLSICRQMEERGYDAKDCAEAIEDALRALIPQDPDHIAGVGNMVEAPTSGNGEGEKQ